MKLLAIDTSTEFCSVAVRIDDHTWVESIEGVAQHARQVLPLAQKLLSAASLQLQQLDAIAFGRGPGSFTGLRIAASVTQALAFVHELPVIPVSTLMALAQQSYRTYRITQVLAAIDARMNEIYVAALSFDEINREWCYTVEEKVANAQTFITPAQGAWALVGNGWSTETGKHIRQTLSLEIVRQDADLKISALDIAELAKNAYRKGTYVEAHQAIPVYLRDNVVHA